MQGYKRALMDAKQGIDKQIVEGNNSIEDFATYRYMVGRSTGLQDALIILENILTKGVTKYEY